MSTIPHQHL